MQQITLRDFLRNIKSYLPPPFEGLQVVRRDGEDFFIYPNVRQVSVTKEVMSDIMSDIPQKMSDVIGTSPEIKESKIFGFCTINRTHPFTKGKEFEIVNFTWEDENGNPVVKEQWGCRKCVSYFENLDRGSIIYH